jgi:hypothetical protein
MSSDARYFSAPHPAISAIHCIVAGLRLTPYLRNALVAKANATQCGSSFQVPKVPKVTNEPATTCPLDPGLCQMFSYYKLHWLIKWRPRI